MDGGAAEAKPVGVTAEGAIVFGELDRRATTDEVEIVGARLVGELEWLTAHRGTLEAEAQMYTLELEAFLRKFGVDYMPHAALAMSIVARELELENLEAPTTPKVAE